jgi:tetratricopeptide (TPR) repeat protein
MARVTLQEYCDEARELISSGAYEEAIAVCRHILQRYPKHIRTYQILGEACLEMGEFEEATDIFKRILERADPENFVAHAGLGILCEEKGQIAEAIWYVERAFEVAPNNEEIRNALRRLYAKRDGTQQTRIKMNKAALARLYARGGQYRQAIEGFRALLGVEANRDRMDLKVALAETLWRDGRREQAAELARDILQTSPDCLKAILLLSMMEFEKGRDDQGSVILAKARGLDPENRAAQALFGESSLLPPSAVKITRIEEAQEAQVAPFEGGEAAVGIAEEGAAVVPVAEEPAIAEEEAEVEAVLTEVAEAEVPPAEEEAAAVAVAEEEGIPEEELEAEAMPTEVAEAEVPPAEEEAAVVAVAGEAVIPEEELEAEAMRMEVAEEEAAPTAVAEEEVILEDELEAEAMPTEVTKEEAAEVAVEEEEVIPEKEQEAEAVPGEVAEEELKAETMPSEVAEKEAAEVAVAEEEVTPEKVLEAEAMSTQVAEPAVPLAEEEARDVAVPEEGVSREEARLASAAIAPAPLSDVERYKLRLEQRPKDDETRLALARAYREQEQMTPALEQYSILKRAKSELLSEVISDMETVVASRPDNLEAHELLADLYVKDTQLQKAVDRYRWILRRLDERST